MSITIDKYAKYIDFSAQFVIILIRGEKDAKY